MLLYQQGKFYPTGRSECLSVGVELTDQSEILVYDDMQNLIAQTDINKLKVCDKLGRLPREIIIPDIGLLVLQVDEKLEIWLSAKKTNRGVFHLENNKSLVWLSSILVPATLYVFFKFVIPFMAITFANYVPAKMVEIASRHTLIALDKSVLDPSQLPEELMNDYRFKWLSITQKLEMPESKFNIQFRQSEKMGANAFALPDGTIVITDELVELLERDTELLSAILLHEIGHVVNKHSMRLIAETITTSLAIDYFFGDLGGLIESFAGISATVMQNQFSQKLEWEADNFAIAKLKDLQRDPGSFAKAMEKLAATLPEEAKLSHLLSSHPLMRERIENTRNNADL